MARLENGTTFPTLRVSRVGGGTIELPDELGGNFGVVLVNRGAWCPYCTAQLTAFNRAWDRFQAAGIGVVSFSVDDEAAAAGLVDKHHLKFPVGYGADAAEVAETLGAYVNDEPHFLQATGFVLAPESTVAVAVYSSGAIGRLVPEDVLGMVEYAKSQHS